MKELLLVSVLASVFVLATVTSAEARPVLNVDRPANPASENAAIARIHRAVDNEYSAAWKLLKTYRASKIWDEAVDAKKRTSALLAKVDVRVVEYDNDDKKYKNSLWKRVTNESGINNGAAPMGQVYSYNASFWRLLQQDMDTLVAFDKVSTPKETDIFAEITRATKHLNLVIAYRITIQNELLRYKQPDSLPGSTGSLSKGYQTFAQRQMNKANAEVATSAKDLLREVFIAEKARWYLRNETIGGTENDKRMAILKAGKELAKKSIIHPKAAPYVIN